MTCVSVLSKLTYRGWRMFTQRSESSPWPAKKRDKRGGITSISIIIASTVVLPPTASLQLRLNTRETLARTILNLNLLQNRVPRVRVLLPLPRKAWLLLIYSSFQAFFIFSQHKTPYCFFRIFPAFFCFFSSYLCQICVKNTGSQFSILFIY